MTRETTAVVLVSVHGPEDWLWDGRSDWVLDPFFKEGLPRFSEFEAEKGKSQG